MASTMIARSAWYGAAVAARAEGARRSGRPGVEGVALRLQARAGKSVTGRSLAREWPTTEVLWREGLGESVRGRPRTTCAAGVYVYNGVSTETVRWCLAAACAVLLLKRDAGARKQFWAGILALEAPRDWVNWARSEYGLWVACIGLALKLFYSIPPELDYPLSVYLLLTCAPAQALAQRGTVGAAVLSTALAVFVAYQYFSNTVRLSDAFQGEHLLNTVLISFVAIVCLGFLGTSVL